MRALPAILFLISVPVWSQFTEFAATDDGQQIYFTTPLIERSTSAGAPTELRVFRIDGRTLQLFAERGSLVHPEASGSGDGASSVHVTGDGQSVALVLTNICLPADPCRSTIQRAEIRGRGALVLGDAQRVLLSRNGQWAVLVPSPFSTTPNPGQPPAANTESILVNLLTGVRTRAGIPATIDGEYALAGDGSLFQRMQGSGTGATQIGIWKNGQLTRIPPVTGAVAFLGLSDDAGTLLASRIVLPPGGQPQPNVLPVPDLVAFDLRTGTSRVVHQLDQPDRYILLGISNDGRRALLRTQSQTGNGPALLINLDTQRTVGLNLPNGEVPVAGTISGYGNAAILGTNSGRILKIPIDFNGNPAPPEELLPPTPFFSATLVAPGALIEFGRPLAGEVDWTNRIRLNGFPIAILSQTATRITGQVPWELRPGLADVAVNYSSDSPLIQRTQVFVAPQAPALVPPIAGTGGVLGGRLIKGDFSGFVTGALKPGEIVHLYMTGLGAVQGAVETGQPAPLNQLRPLAGSIHCRFAPYPSDAETLFAGLAPGLKGIYQLTFRLAADTPPDVVPSGLQCGLNTPGYNFIVASLPAP